MTGSTAFCCAMAAAAGAWLGSMCAHYDYCEGRRFDYRVAATVAVFAAGATLILLALVRAF